MTQALKIVGGVWGVWALLNLAALVLSALLLRPQQPCFNGFRIVIPAGLADLLTPAELAAVVAHEHGHRHHRHIWVNLALICCFMSISAVRRHRLEYEADDYAAHRGHAQALASAIEKLSTHWFDRKRAARLRSKYP